MVRLPIVLGVVACTSACSIVYDPSNLPPALDARAIDAVPIDADPSQLTLTGLAPTRLDEGLGDDGGRPALVVVRGTSLTGGATVDVAFTDGAPAPVLLGYDARPDGLEAALALRIPVMTDLAANAERTLRITITQGDVSRSLDATVVGLDELTLPLTPPAVVPPGGGTYARITVAGATRLTGDRAITLRATAGVVLAAPLDVDAVGATAGPGGCAGGGAERDGDCTPGGGVHGNNAAIAGLGFGGGGGGGSFGGLGGGGAGASAGGPGMVTGNDMLVPLTGGVAVDELNAGNGGGGGGGAGLVTGGSGGGGGGVLALVVGGDLRVTAGALRAAGGDGSSGSATTGGGGGGGSGGALLVRVGGALTASGAWVSAPGGAVASGSSSGGGRGGVGRIRLDAVQGTSAMATTPMVRGPAWSSAPSIASSPPSLTLTGQAGRSFGLRHNDSAAGSVELGVDGTGVVTGLPWQLGANRVCAVARAGQLVPESLACLDVYLVGL